MALTFETESVEVVGAQVLEAQALSVPRKKHHMSVFRL
jgi:hypothetical protein